MSASCNCDIMGIKFFRRFFSGTTSLRAEPHAICLSTLCFMNHERVILLSNSIYQQTIVRCSWSLRQENNYLTKTNHTNQRCQRWEYRLDASFRGAPLSVRHLSAYEKSIDISSFWFLDNRKPKLYISRSWMLALRPSFRNEGKEKQVGALNEKENVSQFLPP